MSFEERIAQLREKADEQSELLATEEATKTALVMPFLAALGYDVFNPSEVVPEYTADVGTKKGEKVDYAVLQDGKIIMLFECKPANTELSGASINQLYRYFSVTAARIGVLTNGIQYWFFSDLDDPNKMDARPFLEFDLQDARESTLVEVRKLAKEGFDLDRMLNSASELKFTGEIRRHLAKQLEEPEEEFVRFFFSRVHPGGRLTAAVKDHFTSLVRKALQQFISERVSGRLRSALQREDEDAQKAREAEAEPDDGIETTDEEIEGFQIVRAIVANVVDPTRVVYRDTRSYMGVLLDDNNRKPICRLWFNRKQRYVGVFDEDKNEKRIPLERITDLYMVSDMLRDTVVHYEELEAGSGE
jgi:hypothetical protein